MSLRTEQLAAQIQRLSSEFLNQKLEFPPGSLTTVVGADITKDLREIKLFVSVLPESMRGTTLELLRKRAPMLQRHIARALPRRSVPRVVIEGTDSLGHELENS